MTGYILDTNHLGLALDKNSSVYQRILAARKAGVRVGTCPPVLCELAVGIEQTSRRDANWKALEVFLKQIRIWPLDVSTAQVYGRLYQELRASGRVLSQVDMMVAAMARRMKLTVLTTDGDYQKIEGIKVEDWIGELK